MALKARYLELFAGLGALLLGNVAKIEKIKLK